MVTTTVPDTDLTEHIQDAPRRLTVKHSIAGYVEAWSTSPFSGVGVAPWRVTQDAPHLIQSAIDVLGGEYGIAGCVAIHASATVESGAVIKGPAIIGPDAFVAAGAYLRGGVFLDRNCIVGPGCELKTSFMFSGSKLAHLNFVGDSVIGSGVNIEAGAIVANYRNELADKVIRIAAGTSIIETGVEKFGALIGDGARIGANAVVAPGALIAAGSVIGRLELFDQYPR